MRHRERERARMNEKRQRHTLSEIQKYLREKGYFPDPVTLVKYEKGKRADKKRCDMESKTEKCH